MQTRAGGKPRDVHVAGKGMDIHHGLNGNRRVTSERADHSRVVSERGGRGYVQRPYSHGGHEFGRRTYYRDGRAYNRFYRRYGYHGMFLDVYSPEYYFAPAFYGWAYNPWLSPVPYAWGFGAAPWYGYYGFYFTPYPVYPSASAWLTDYMISTSLADSYQANAEAAGPGRAPAAAAAPNGAQGLTPQVKDQIALEVQRQIALENTESRSAGQDLDPDPASSSIQRMMTDTNPHVFMAGSDLDVVDASGTECAISAGDALQFSGPLPAGASAAALTVLSDKGGNECRAGAQVTVALVDIQDMQNHMRETIDQGMGDLRAKSGKGGLPALPASASAAPVKAPFAAAAPAPEPNVAAEIAQQAQAADVEEKRVVAESAAPASSGPGPNAGPAPESAEAPSAPSVTVGLGQSVDAVTAALGQPASIVDLGTKKIYVYKDMKITFVGGKSTNIQ